MCLVSQRKNALEEGKALDMDKLQVAVLRDKMHVQALARMRLSKAGKHLLRGGFLNEVSSISEWCRARLLRTSLSQ